MRMILSGPQRQRRTSYRFRLGIIVGVRKFVGCSTSAVSNVSHRFGRIVSAPFTNTITDDCEELRVRIDPFFLTQAALDDQAALSGQRTGQLLNCRDAQY